MEVSAALMPPPALAIDTTGPVGEAIATHLVELLGSQTEACAPGGVRPAMLMVEPGDAGMVDLRERLSAATAARGQRVWVVLCDAAQVLGADAVIDEIGGVDALLLVDASHPASAAAALAGWTWLRHDAPSLALGTLRDSSGHVCRIATLTATTPAEPPTSASAAPRPTPDRAAHMWQKASEGAQRTGEQVARDLLADEAVSLADAVPVLTQRSQSAGVELGQGFMAEVSHWPPSELRHLQQQRAQEPDTSTVANAAAAAMELAQAHAAMDQEESRVGFASRFGRRKRLAELQAAREAAEAHWRAAAIEFGRATTSEAFTEAVQRALPIAVAEADQRSALETANRARAAVEHWLERTAGAAQRLAPASPPAEVAVARSWGDAQPQIRRHLLVPAAVAVGDVGPSSTQLTVHPAEGLPRPLAVAWLLGLSASSFGADSGPGFEHSQSSGEPQN